MSVEALILLALFIVLPLIQQLIHATRQRNRRPPEPAERQAGTPQPLARTPPPPELAVPPLPDTTPHRTMGRRTTPGLRTRRDLRRAIVLVAILGPCRATHPYDWPEHAGRS